MHLLIWWFHAYWPDGAIIQYKYLNRIYFDCNCALAGRENIYLHKNVSMYKVYSTISMNRTAFLTVNTNT